MNFTLLDHHHRCSGVMDDLEEVCQSTSCRVVFPASPSFLCTAGTEHFTWQSGGIQGYMYLVSFSRHPSIHPCSSYRPWNIVICISHNQQLYSSCNRLSPCREQQSINSLASFFFYSKEKRKKKKKIILMMMMKQPTSSPVPPSTTMGYGMIRSMAITYAKMAQQYQHLPEAPPFFFFLMCILWWYCRDSIYVYVSPHHHPTI